MKNASFGKRLLVLCAGMLIMAFGVAFSIKAGLGTSPISSLPYVLSLFTPLTVGTATIAMHCVLILLQILILRRRYQLIQLTQLPVAILFGYLTDFAVWALQPIPVTSYPESILLCVVGILLVGTGVSFEVNAGLVTLAGEGLILAICDTFHLPFPRIKICFDCTLVLSAGSTQVSLDAKGELTLKSSKKLAAESAEIEEKGSAKVAVQGAAVEVKGTTSLDLSAAGNTTIKGAMVGIN